MSNPNRNDADPRMVTQPRTDAREASRPVRPGPEVSGVPLGFVVRDCDTFEAFGATITLERTGAGRVTCVFNDERIDALTLVDRLFDAARKQREAQAAVPERQTTSDAINAVREEVKPLAAAAKRLRG